MSRAAPVITAMAQGSPRSISTVDGSSSPWVTEKRTPSRTRAVRPPVTNPSVAAAVATAGRAGPCGHAAAAQAGGP
ncbi:hypothetical protein [Blastococcus brunescens]|uniref:Uncharacterized protein n=1 Tax=Blastococcus brunescens TaxID=1564165 RepID=A0ABZ1B026_9ACTN|nr:hypothetical protein [Blastococcus sp. BMG 8361]WRL63737.1 hypothetical protein U6N30_29500 [Blastococcus sp. BMG 8361]